MPDDRPAVGPRLMRRNQAGRVTRVQDVVPDEAHEALASALAATITGEVRFDPGSRALYATDASNYRQVPIGVVVPRTVDDIVKTVELCRTHGAPLVMRGGGTSLAGQGCNVAVLVDCSRHLNRVLSVDPEKRLAVVEPGCVLDRLRTEAEQYHLTFGPDPSTHDHNTLGGMIGNDSCGVHSIMAGRTADNVERLEVLTYDGTRMVVGPTTDAELAAIRRGGGRPAEIYGALDAFRQKYATLIRERYPDIPRRVSGYENLDQLLPERGFNVARALVGTECTCVTVLKAELNLVPSPPKRVLAIIGFADVYNAADAVPGVLKHSPIGLEGIDDLLIEFMKRSGLHPDDIRMLPPGGGWLIAEFGAETIEEATASARKLLDEYESQGRSVALVASPGDQAKIWEVREAGLGATAHVPNFPETWPGWEDSAVRREDLGRYLRELKALFHAHGYEASVYGHFGDGLIHCRVPFDLRTETGLNNWQHFLEQAADLVVRYGGSLSGEHGDGQARAALLEKMYGSELIEAFRVFKSIWDPAGKMNPGKIVDPFPITSNLRLGPAYHPIEPHHHFAFSEEGGSFVKATRRCVGVGLCRRTDSAKSVMCPSYMATHEEKHSTRGRARLLFEMLQGEVIKDGWRSAEVEDALDLCLGCKGCKSDCPVQVDMATYKAEFRAHHYAGRIRPRAAYSMGLIHRWSSLAGHVPWLANALMQTPGLSAAMKWIGDIAPQRHIPQFANEPFTAWHRRNAAKRSEHPRVMLWPDTFNNYFRPATAIAATRVLESLGYDVVIPGRPLCCGRPLYDWGMLDAAKRLWRRTLETLQPAIEAGTPIIGLEPACVSAFRDELPSLLHGEERAKRLSRQTVFLTEFLDRECKVRRLERPRAALVHLHCHQHAIIKRHSEEGVLDKLGLEYEIMASGCCGMAGSFGFETAKYPVSIACAERVLLPRVRAAPLETIILANGYSCREQIEQCTGRVTKHVAELLAENL